MAKRLTGQQRRFLIALLENPAGISREDADRIARASNSPDVVHKLRCKGLIIHTQLIDFQTVDNTRGRYGVYSLPSNQRQLARELLGGNV